MQRIGRTSKPGLSSEALIILDTSSIVRKIRIGSATIGRKDFNSCVKFIGIGMCFPVEIVESRYEIPLGI